MKVSCKLIRIVSILILLGLTHTGFAAGDRMRAGERLLAMDDDMKPKQPDSMGSGGSNTGKPHDHGEMLMRMEQMMRGQIGGMSGTGTAKGPANVTELVEERITFLKAELQITDKQMADWNALAEALRSGRRHLAEARKLAVLDDKTPSAERLEHYERHLTERLEAVKSARAGFTPLYPTLTGVQKQTADAILLPLIATF
jgi:hypothetical protein